MSPRKRNANAHTHDRNLWLARLMAESGSVCHWCRRPIVRVKDLKRWKLEVVLDSHFDVTWRNSEGTSTCSKATLDHVVPLARGGARTRENLVPACARCNHNRNAKENPPKTPKGRKDWRDKHPIPDDPRELGEAGA